MAENGQPYVIGSVHHKTLVITVLLERISDPETSYALRDEILALVDPKTIRNVVVDLKHVTFVGSIGLLAFLAVRRRLEGGRIVLCNLSDAIRGIFEVSRLLSHSPSVTAPFEAEGDVETALARLSG